MVPDQDRASCEYLLQVPARTTLSQQLLNVLLIERPWLKSKYLVELCELSHPFWAGFQTLGDPLSVTAAQYELLLKNVDQVNTVEAAHCHDCQVKLCLQIKTTILTPDQAIGRLSEKLVEPRKPA